MTIPDTISFEDMIDQLCADPEFVVECEENNCKWDETAAAELEITVNELWDRLGIVWHETGQ